MFKRKYSQVSSETNESEISIANCDSTIGNLLKYLSLLAGAKMEEEE